MTVRLGTRRSPLALVQANDVARRLRAAHDGLEVELVEIVSTGDREQSRPLREVGGKGLFVKELDDALLADRIDAGVHSLKDVPSTLAEQTVMAATIERADARDTLVSRKGYDASTLPTGARVGTTSLRRAAWLRALRSDLAVETLRGNVGTRLDRLRDGAFDAVFLARAGLDRLRPDLSGLTVVALDVDACVPAPGQGVVAITARADDARTRELFAPLDDEATHVCARAERAFARVFGGGCHLPLGAHAALRDGAVHLRGYLSSADGTQIAGDVESADLAAARAAGERLARRVLDRGGREILDGLDLDGLDLDA